MATRLADLFRLLVPAFRGLRCSHCDGQAQVLIEISLKIDNITDQMYREKKGKPNHAQGGSEDASSEEVVSVQSMPMTNRAEKN